MLTAHFCATRVAKRYLATCRYAMLSVRDRVTGGDCGSVWGAGFWSRASGSSYVP